MPRSARPTGALPTTQAATARRPIQSTTRRTQSASATSVRPHAQLQNNHPPQKKTKKNVQLQPRPTVAKFLFPFFWGGVWGLWVLLLRHTTSKHEQHASFDSRVCCPPSRLLPPPLSLSLIFLSRFSFPLPFSFPHSLFNASPFYRRATRSLSVHSFTLFSLLSFVLSFVLFRPSYAPSPRSLSLFVCIAPHAPRAP